MAPASSALANLRVLDLTRVRAGPTCCRVFADFGADAIKIEAPPGVDSNEAMSGAGDGYDLLNLHRNKRSLTLNLREQAGKEAFLRLVVDADVVVENFSTRCERPDRHRLCVAARSQFAALRLIPRRLCTTLVSVRVEILVGIRRLSIIKVRRTHG